MKRKSIHSKSCIRSIRSSRWFLAATTDADSKNVKFIVTNRVPSNPTKERLVEALAKQDDRRIEVKYEIRDALPPPSF